MLLRLREDVTHTKYTAHCVNILTILYSFRNIPGTRYQELIEITQILLQFERLRPGLPLLCWYPTFFHFPPSTLVFLGHMHRNQKIVVCHLPPCQWPGSETDRAVCLLVTESSHLLLSHSPPSPLLQELQGSTLDFGEDAQDTLVLS